MLKIRKAISKNCCIQKSWKWKFFEPTKL